MPKAKTPEEWNYAAQLTAERDAKRLSDLAVAREFAKRVEARREAGAVLDPATIPGFADLYGATRDAQRAAAAAAEAARIAALTPRDLWLSTLPLGERQRIARWESINRQSYPFEIVAK